MNSTKGAIKWLERLKEPRTIGSLISEIYGEAIWFGLLFEREVADILNFYELSRLSFEEFTTEEYTLARLIKEVESRQIVEQEQLATLRDAKEARNALAHRLLSNKLVVSRTEREMLLAEIDALYFRVWRGYKMASAIKWHFAAQIGVTEERITAKREKLMAEAEIEDENIRLLIEESPDAT